MMLLGRRVLSVWGVSAGFCRVPEHCFVGYRFKALVLVAAMQHVLMSKTLLGFPPGKYCWLPAIPCQ